MRIPLTLLASFVLLTANAQIDINKMMQDRLAKQGSGTGAGDGSGSGVRMEDDNDPFVPNSFIGSYRMEMHTYKGTEEEKNSPTNMHCWTSADMTMMRVDAAQQRGQDMKIMHDLKGKWTYTLMTDDKGKKTAMKSRKKKVVMDNEAKQKDTKVTVTDETKLIDGHTCTKVIAVSEDGTWTGWVAKDVKSPFLDLARHQAQRGDDSHMRAAQGVDGMPLEFEWVPTDGKSRMMVYIHDLVSGKVDESVFSLDGYEVMEMPSFGR